MFSAAVGLAAADSNTFYNALLIEAACILAVWPTLLFLWWVASKVKTAARSKTSFEQEDVAMKLCQFCAEEIKPAAILCKHCGTRLDRSTTRDILWSVALVAILLVGYTFHFAKLEQIGNEISDLSSSVRPQLP
jgi:uncharacterized paraquat-inducible protein A